MARQLREQGEEVALLAAFDSGPPNLSLSRRWTLAFLSRLPRRLWYWVIDDLCTCPPRRMANRVVGGLIDGGRRLLRVFQRTRPHEPELNIRTVFGVSHLPEPYSRFLNAHYRAVRKYSPRPCDLRVTLFRARAQWLLRHTAEDLGWGAVAQCGVEVFEIPGHHGNLFEEPSVASLAERLVGVLADAQAAAWNSPSGP
jgi:thioesterase domain-containing protein